MDGSISEESCRGFAAALASPAPAPGGGGAAALMGALAASLCSMAALLTAGRKKYASVRGQCEALAAAAQEESRALTELIDRDAEGFLPLREAYALPKDLPDRAEKLRAAALLACRAPMEMLRRCGETAALLERAMELTSPALISDVGCGAAACQAALEAAAMNIYVNTRTLPGDPEAAAMEAETRRTLDCWLPRVRQITDRAAAYLTGENDG